jgi:hypothetical protein
MITLFASRSMSAVSWALTEITSPAGWAAPPAAGAAASPPKPPAITLMKLRFIARHMMYGEDRAARAHQRAGDDEQVVGEHEARWPPPPIRVAVQHRHHHRHVGAADRHHHVHAEEERDHRHQDERRSCPPGWRAARRNA